MLSSWLTVFCMEYSVCTDYCMAITASNPQLTARASTYPIRLYFQTHLQTRICSAPKNGAKRHGVCTIFNLYGWSRGENRADRSGQENCLSIVTCQMEVSCEALVFFTHRVGRKFGSRFRRDDLIWFMNDLCIYVFDPGTGFALLCPFLSLCMGFQQAPSSGIVQSFRTGIHMRWKSLPGVSHDSSRHPWTWSCTLPLDNDIL